MGPFPRGGPLASFQGNIPDLMNDTCENLSVIPPNPKGNEIWSRESGGRYSHKAFLGVPAGGPAQARGDM